MAYECAEHDEPTAARFLFTDTETGDTISLCAEHLPDFLMGTYLAIMNAQGTSTADVVKVLQAAIPSIEEPAKPKRPPRHKPVAENGSTDTKDTATVEPVATDI